MRNNQRKFGVILFLGKLFFLEILEKLSGINISISQIQKVTISIGNKLIITEENFIENPEISGKNKKIINK